MTGDQLLGAVRAALGFGAALAVVLTGCTGTPEPDPSSPAPSATPTQVPAEGPDDGSPAGAFEIDCSDIAPAMSEFAGTPADEVVPALGLAGSPGWYPGPAQYLAQRAGGIACSYDGAVDAQGMQHGWSMMILPGAQAIVDALAWFPEQTSTCDPGSCTLTAREGDALLVGRIDLPEITPDDTDDVRRLAQQWVDKASATQQDEPFVPKASPLAGTGCEALLPPGDLSALWGVDAGVQDQFGGWDAASEAYFVIGGATLCIYSSDPGDYDAEQYLMLTDLPGGTWAFEHPLGRTPVDVAGADAAYRGGDDHSEFIDILVAEDWVRLTGPVDGDHDLVAAAAAVAARVAAAQ